MDERGCKDNKTCERGLHPRVCPNSLHLKCSSNPCPHRLHLTKCDRDQPHRKGADVIVSNQRPQSDQASPVHNQSGRAWVQDRAGGVGQGGQEGQRGQGRQGGWGVGQANDNGRLYQRQNLAGQEQQHFRETLTIQQVLEETRKLVQFQQQQQENHLLRVQQLLQTENIRRDAFPLYC